MMNPEKLAKLQEQARTSSTAMPRRKVVKRVQKPDSDLAGLSGHATTGAKMASILRTINAQVLPSIEEVNMFHTEGHVIHFKAPKVQAAIGSNTYIVTGNGASKEMAELAPGILAQLGPNALANLQRLAMEYQKQAAAAGYSVEDFAKMEMQKAASATTDDDIPDLVKNFEGAHMSAN